MKNDRLTSLLAFLEEDPDDPFLIYAIANEYLNNDDQKARQYYDKLLSEHPDYLPTYYHAAHLYWKLKTVKRAREIFEKGIELARSQGQALPLRELQNAYQNFIFEEED